MLYKELKNLKLDLNPSFMLPMPADGQYQLTPYTKEEVLGKNSLIQFLKLGLFWDIRQVQIFTTVGKYTGVIHVDGTDLLTQEGAINWIYNEEDGASWTTEWFRPIEPKSVIVTDKKDGPGSGILYEPEECELIDSWNSPCLNPTLLHVGVPHRIVNKTDTVRHCISVRFKMEKQNFHTLNSLLD